MPYLIVGPVTHESAVLWVRGGWLRRRVHVRTTGRGQAHDRELVLARSRDFTAAVEISGLQAGTAYEVEARFEGPGGWCGQRVLGRLRTFPAPDSDAPFSFLHASCNLSVVLLTQAGAVAASAVGAFAALHLLSSSGSPVVSGMLRVARGVRGLVVAARDAARGLFARLTGRPPRALQRSGSSFPFLRFFVFVLERTAWWQPKPVLQSPFAPLAPLLLERSPPAFMIHAGDQIYFDFPLPSRQPSLMAYRRTYRQAFFGDPDQRAFLAGCPHYMTLDDHEVVDGFARDHVPIVGRDPEAYTEPALRAYDEYVASRQTPNAGTGHRGYTFEHGDVRFLVLDTRTQRIRGERRMLDEAQLELLLHWLDEHRQRIKFVVSSVPFLAELSDAADLAEECDDKWAGRFYRGQRDRILDFVHEKSIGRLVFLVGDMHCTYHVTTQLGTTEHRVLVHELAGGPIHQAAYGARSDFREEMIGRTVRGGVPLRTWLRAFSGAAAGVLRVSVSPGRRPEVRWRVVPTSDPPRRSGAQQALAGRIDF